MILQKQLNEQKSQGTDGSTLRTFTISDNARDELGKDSLEAFAEEIFSRRRVAAAQAEEDAGDADVE
eukprot:jgi/Botrbrau1/12614/Bobra.0169s0141.1